MNDMKGTKNGYLLTDHYHLGKGYCMSGECLVLLFVDWLERGLPVKQSGDVNTLRMGHIEELHRKERPADRTTVSPAVHRN